MDANHAGCRRTKRGSHLLLGISVTRPLLAILSGQSEYVAQIRSTIEGIYGVEGWNR